MHNMFRITRRWRCGTCPWRGWNNSMRLSSVSQRLALSSSWEAFLASFWLAKSRSTAVFHHKEQHPPTQLHYDGDSEAATGDMNLVQRRDSLIWWLSRGWAVAWFRIDDQKVQNVNINYHSFFSAMEGKPCHRSRLQSRYSIYWRWSARRRKYDALGRVGWPLWTRGYRMQSTTSSTIQEKINKKIMKCRSQSDRCRVNSGLPFTAAPAPLLYTDRRTILERVEDRGGRQGCH